MVEVARGELFLGGTLDPETGERDDGQVLYEAHQLTTHGVIVGMTGSGKTGLGIVALEEALLSGIPALIIDPKGDMGNLLLNFPLFQPSDFRPWIDEGEARRKEVTPEVLATQTADLWKNGLGSWDIGPDRMTALGTGAGFTIYTPGSTSGIPLNIIGSLAAPAIDWDSDAETGRDEIEGFVSSLLVLAGIVADPISSPEHILLANIIEKAWREGRSLDLATLIGQVQEPPIRKLGVFDLDTFFPKKERTKLAMRLNGLVASPSFASWLEGPPLDVQTLLYEPDGRPKASVLYLAHLSDAERQFVVTLLLSKVVTWMRTQAGTSDLRALIYMDEVFGFAPPTAEPPSKKPILTILKQARAFGVGMLLSTQNPVDLDYKAMSNAGTWMIGRLQTERDKARIVEALKSASGEVDVPMFDRLISDLGKREFVLHSTRSKAPSVFTTRWAMSYLAGPLTRDQVAELMKDAPAYEAPATAPIGETAAPVVGEDATVVIPEIAPKISVYHLDPAAPWANEVGASSTGRRYEAGIVARVHLTYDDQYAAIDHDEEWEAVFFPLGKSFDAGTARAVDYDDRDLRSERTDDATYVLPDAPLDSASYFTSVSTDLKNHLLRNRSVEIFKNPGLKLYSRVGETTDEFSERCGAAAEDAADADIAKLKDRYEVKIKRVKDQLVATERRVRELETDVEGKRQSELLSGAGDLLSVFLGGRRRSGGLGRAARRRSSTSSTQERLRTAEQKMGDQHAELNAIEDDLATDVLEITEKWDAIASEIETVEIGLEKTDISVDEVAVVWIPVE
ncbi:MAG: ATP-binding protein [Acidimicrobiia bacterium]|nr:ATP-binding protein [Acidimicrobiia bacterium]